MPATTLRQASERFANRLVKEAGGDLLSYHRDSWRRHHRNFDKSLHDAPYGTKKSDQRRYHADKGESRHASADTFAGRGLNAFKVPGNTLF